MPAEPVDSDVSTETASSPVTDHSQSSLLEDFQTRETVAAPKEEKGLQEASSSDSLLKELDMKSEIPELKSEATPRLVLYVRVFFSSSTNSESYPGW